MAALAVWALYEHAVAPALRFLVTHPANQVIDELGERLRIGIRPFQRTKRQALIHSLLADGRVQAAAEKYARENDLTLSAALRKVERYAREIVPAFNAYLYFRIGYWVGRTVAQSLYRVRLGYLDAAGLAKIDSDATVVFVMNHRSNMDYVLAGYLAAEQTSLSYAVGEWARLWPLSALIRAMGAYFVRRNSADELYRRVLERYIAMATEAGVPQAVFPEGGLSRDGRMREPRLGVIDYMMRGFRLDGERDLVFVPLGINYDRVLEDRTLLSPVSIGRAKTVLGTFRFVAHIAHIFLERRSLTELDLKAEVGRLLERLGAAHVYIPRRDLDYALTVGLRMLRLRRLVDERDGVFTAREDELPLLRYYANSIGHLL